MKKTFCTLILLLIYSNLWAGTAYYVNPEAAGGGTGTYTNPWNSIAQVNAKAFSTGDDVYFKAGTTLTMTAHLQIDWNGTEADPVVIGAYYGDGLFGLNGGARPILLGSKTTPIPTSIYKGLIDYIGPGYITVQDLHVKNSYGLGIELMEGYYADARRALGFTIRNNIVQDVGRQGILMARASYGLVENNLVDGASQTPVLVAAGGVTYGGGGIEISGMNSETSVHNVCRGNTVRRAGESIGNYQGARYTIIENNIVYDPGRVGIYGANSRDGIIRNNIVYWPDPEDSLNHMQPGVGRHALIHLDSENHVSTINNWMGGWKIYGNLLAGGRWGIWIQSNAYTEGVFVTDTDIYDNVIVDCDYNFWFHQAVTGWERNIVKNNYSYIFTQGLIHVLIESPIGVTFDANHYNTDIDGVSGNAATAAVYDDPDLIKTTGWRDLPVDGSVDASWWAFVGGTPPPPPSESALNSANAYAGGTYTPLRAYLFDDGAGSTTLTDHSSAAAHGTLTNPAWSANGLTMATVGQIAAVPVPSFGSSWTIFTAFTSEQLSGSDYAKLWFYYNTTVRDFQFERYISDTEFRSDVGGFTDYTAAWTPVIDQYDQNFHTLMVTYDDPTNQRCFYQDGSLQSCQTVPFASPAWGGSMYLGGKNDGSRIAGVTFHAWYAWPNVLAAADAASLHADYDQLFSSPPTRVFDTVPFAHAPVGVAQSGRPISVVTPGKPIVVMGR